MPAIMVDPKNVELSSTTASRHLLTPVVTDPESRGRAQMGGARDGKERYKKMSKLGVRTSTATTRAWPRPRRKARSSPAPSTRLRQAEREAIYENEELDLEPHALHRRHRRRDGVF